MIKKCKECGACFENNEIRNIKSQFIRSGNSFCSKSCKKAVLKRYNKYRRERLWFSGKRDEVLKRDNFECQFCRTKEDLCVHHKDGNGRGSKDPNNSLDNLITLCLSCHRKLHQTLPREKYYKFVLENKEKTNRSIAISLGITHPTVAIIRKELGIELTRWKKNKASLLSQ